MFQIDKPFNEFKLLVYDPVKDSIREITNKTFKDKILVLFFYPADFTFVCPTELADMQARAPDFKENGAEVVVVSTDTVYSHKGWVETEELIKGFKYLMASDRGGKLSRELGIYDETSGMAGRGAFIIDGFGILRGADITADQIGRSAGEILRKVKATKFVNSHKGQVCPASWDEGSATIKPSIKISGRVKKNIGK
ncbi:MAG: redoxin domain-containing protein [Patescibacteria group bacterium]